MTNAAPAFGRSINSDVTQSPTTPKPERLLSIDVLRGLTIAFMILVNDQTGPAPFHELVHANWNGFTATDLVFPTFLMLVGLSTVLSTAARLAHGATRRQLFLHTLRRTLVLMVFGFVVNNFPFFQLASARYYGVLPRIAICYFIVSTLYLLSPGWRDKVVLAIACLVGYWALMRFVPVPGFGVPTHGVVINDRDANLAAWLDRQIFSAPHLYEKTRDPEGLLSTLPAIATTLFGMLAAMWLRTNRAPPRKAVMMAITGAVFLCLALAWDPFFPINKKLWTSSYALFAGGWTLLLLAAAIFIIDVWHVGARIKINSNANTPKHPALYKPLLVLGTNAILAYMISELGDSVVSKVHTSSGASLKTAAFHAIASHVPATTWASLLYSIAFLLVCWLLVLPFYRKGLFLRL